MAKETPMKTGLRHGVCALALLGGLVAAGAANAEVARARDLGIGEMLQEQQ